jgi:hypothetical protein
VALPAPFPQAAPRQQVPANPFAFGQQAAAPRQQSAMSYLQAPPQMPPDARDHSKPQQKAYEVAQPVKRNMPLGHLGDGMVVQQWQDTKQKDEADKQTAIQQNNWFGGEGKFQKQEMSVDQYLQLSPIQRAAVDANTALVAAAEQDTASWAKEKVGGQGITDKTYLDKVKNTFGETGGSDTYAPRTLTVLNDLGIDLKGRDLDQYLNMSALVTDKDLTGLAAGAVAGADPRQENAANFAKAATNRLSATLASGQTLLDSIRSSSDENRKLFGAPSTMAPIGFNPSSSPRDEDLAQAFDIFSQTRAQADLTPDKVGSIYAELEQKHNLTPNQVAQYFETRLQANEYLNATTENPVPLGGPGTSVEYLAPKDFRDKYLTRGQ